MIRIRHHRRRLPRHPSTLPPVQAIPPSSRTDFGQVALSSQIRRSPFAGTVVLGPFLLSLGLRLGLQSNLPAKRRCGILPLARVGSSAREGFGDG
jgi:hypothetical protein